MTRRAIASSLLVEVERRTNVEIGARLRDARVMKGVRGRDLAKALGHSESLLNQMERGETVVRAVSLVVAAQTLDIPIAYFFEELGVGALKNPILYASRVTNARRMLVAGEIAREAANIDDQRLRGILRELITHLSLKAGPATEEIEGDDDGENSA